MKRLLWLLLLGACTHSPTAPAAQDSLCLKLPPGLSVQCVPEQPFH